MSYTTKATIPVDWVIISSEFQPEQYEEKKLGNVFNDFWSLKLFKKTFQPYRHHIILSIERKRAEHRIMAIIKLKFTDPRSWNSLDVKYVRRFQHVDNTKASYTLNKSVREMFNKLKTIHVTGEVFFHMIPSSGPAVAPLTLNLLSADLSKLCCSNIFSDVILRCGSEVFNAHKNILATRCPVFAEMLENDVKDEIKIDIEDLAPHVLKAVLIFIYSGETEHMTFRSACELLCASDRYRLNELKVLCVNHITSSLSVTNVLDYFYEYEVVKSYALEFIAENISEIKRTAQWQNFKRQFPDLVSKLGDISEIEDTKQWKDNKQECPGPSHSKTEIYSTPGIKTETY